eukprot:9501244-Pyramimonas_sp.AAC.1
MRRVETRPVPRCLSICARDPRCRLRCSRGAQSNGIWRRSRRKDRRAVVLAVLGRRSGPDLAGP